MATLHEARMPDNDTTLLSTFFSLEVDDINRRSWMAKNWTYSFYGVVFYIAFIYGGPEVMKSRKPMDLKKVMILWNFLLALFSIVASSIVIPEFVSGLLTEGGIHRSICVKVPISPISSFCCWLFALSKLVELGDTVFIILRKRRLIFLHWYHHITVLLFTWYAGRDQISTGVWFIAVNCFVHSAMYTYYFVSAMGVRVPRPVAMAITLSQLSQMVVGVWINSYAYVKKLEGVSCEVPFSHLQLGFLMYASYFVLFAQFFHKAYMSKGKNMKKVA